MSNADRTPIGSGSNLPDSFRPVSIYDLPPFGTNADVPSEEARSTGKREHIRKDRLQRRRCLRIPAQGDTAKASRDYPPPVKLGISLVGSLPVSQPGLSSLEGANPPVYQLSSPPNRHPS